MPGAAGMRVERGAHTLVIDMLWESMKEACFRRSLVRPSQMRLMRNGLEKRHLAPKRLETIRTY